MCTCASCSYTDGFAGKSFAEWPRGNPSGKRVSEAEYRSHVAHLWQGVTRNALRFEPGQPPQFPSWMRGNGPIAPAPQWLHDWINRKAPDPDESRPASPTQPGKAEPHLHGDDRTAAPSATIYEMAKEKAKRPVGRPALPGGAKRVLVSLDPATLERGRKLGDGNLSAGIRKALAKAR